MKVWFFPIVLFSIFLIYIIGYIEDKVGIFKAENNMIYDRMLHFTRLENHIKELREEVDKINKK